MSKSVTVNFADGTSHVYDNVPDDVSDDQVKQRAQTDFSDKSVEAVGRPTPTETATQNYNNASMTDKVIGGLGAGANLVGQAITSPVGHILEGATAVKYLGDRLGGRMPTAPIAPTQAVMQPQLMPNAVNGPIASTSAPTNRIQFPSGQPVQQTQPSVLQRGMDIASKIRQAAAQRVVGLGTSGAAVPGAVAAGGAAATGLAGGQMGAMTPEQRKAYYDNSMLGAMGGDAGLAAAIMNRGQ